MVGVGRREQRQEEEFRKELRSNTAAALPEAVRERVRESHVPFHRAEGASYARHLALRLYAGEQCVGPPHPTRSVVHGSLASCPV